MKTTRLEAFSDRVLGITITINGMRESQATRMGPHRAELFTSQIAADLRASRIYTLGSVGVDRFLLNKRSARCSTRPPQVRATAVSTRPIPRTDQ
jgi:hypothetical protein